MFLLNLVRENYDKLNTNDLRIYSFVVQNKNEVIDLNINELADKLGLSTSSIMTFTKKLGLEGYSELRYLVKWSEDESKTSFDDNEIEYTKNDINLTMTMMTSLDLSGLFESISTAEKIFVVGNGYTQLNVAEELKRNFLNVGKILNVIDDPSSYESYKNSLKDGDVLFALSFSGENRELIDFINSLDEKIYIASITKLSNNTISHMSDYNISFVTHEVFDFDQRMKISPISQFYVVIDFIILKYLSYIEGENKKRI
ncbi:MurR/RpiR family transcriptional regulator [Anaerococcus prevotii]|uniref:Transcriptional regulator, RpiR family n=1 Tax=Anaerococcus prevotii ACS-065-V-Col13 TaxID=879305 RepID=F0GVV7_9FIRM|nr:MurR/RpiR family transcriptional regulator [Anaerococcus prevotii]EGC82044.1 transcriptional regulator, RpiR family [Anaerococcus prevotii ACS-065-V-Col13]